MSTLDPQTALALQNAGRHMDILDQLYVSGIDALERHSPSAHDRYQNRLATADGHDAMELESKAEQHLLFGAICALTGLPEDSVAAFLGLNDA